MTLAAQDAHAFLVHSKFLNQKFGPQGSITGAEPAVPQGAQVMSTAAPAPAAPAFHARAARGHHAGGGRDSARRSGAAEARTGAPGRRPGDPLHRRAGRRGHPFRRLRRGWTVPSRSARKISTASSLMQGRFMQAQLVVSSLGVQGDQRDPRAARRAQPRPGGDLLQPRKLLGMIPFGDRLEAYFRKYESAAEQLQDQHGPALCGARRHAEGRHRHRGHTRQAVGGDEQAGRGIALATQLDARLEGRGLFSAGGHRSATRQRAAPGGAVLARQNLIDIQTQQAVCVNGYLALDVLKKAGREMMNGWAWPPPA